MFRKSYHWVNNRNAFVVFLALVAVPVGLMALHGSLRNHGCALQNNAVHNMRSLPILVITYREAYGTYPPSLAALGPPPSGQPSSTEAAGYIDPKLASGNYIGYFFHYTLKKPLHNGDSPAGYVIVADPIVDDPGRHHYYVSEDAIVRSEERRPATAESPQSNEDSCVCW